MSITLQWHFETSVFFFLSKILNVDITNSLKENTLQFFKLETKKLLQKPHAK